MTGRRALALATLALVYAAIHIALLGFAEEGGHRQPDSFDYFSQAELLYGNTNRGELDSSRVIRQPGYATILAGLSAAGMTKPDTFLVIVQVLALWLTGLVTRAVVLRYLSPQIGDLALALVVLNPNAIGMAQLLLPETFFTLLLVIAFGLLLIVVEEGKWWVALSLGAAMGTAVLFRPELKYALLLLPIILATVSVLSEGRHVVRGFVQGLGATAVALLLVLPWSLTVQSVTGRLDVTAGSNSQVFLAMNVVFAERRVNPTLSLQETYEIVVERARTAAGGTTPTNGTYVAMLLDYPLTQLAAMLVTSQVKWLVSGGAQNINGMLGLRVENSHEVYAAGGFSNRIGAWASTLASASAGAMAITALALVFAMAARLLGLAGIAHLFRRRHWPLLVSVLGLLVYYMAVLLLNGLSRYRVPVEPMLMVLAVAGLDGWRANVSGFLRAIRSGLGLRRPR